VTKKKVLSVFQADGIFLPTFLVKKVVPSRIPSGFNQTDRVSSPSKQF
jgi:hypothetical protein